MAAPLLLTSGAAISTFSVVRYDLRIVLGYLALLAVLAFCQLRPVSATVDSLDRDGVSRPAAAVALIAAALANWLVPRFSYIPDPRARVLTMVVTLACLAGAALIALPWRPGPQVALLVAAAGYTAASAASLRLDPAPRIDVWYTLQGAADGLRAGRDMYTQVWVGPPGPMTAFTYLPWTTVLLAPGRWLAGDVRWTLILITVAGGFAMRVLAGRSPLHPGPDRAPAGSAAGAPDDDRRRTGCLAGALLLLLPGTLTQVEQAWTEPLLLGCLAAGTLALVRGRDWLAVLFIALALASKQHIALLLPVLAGWPRFGPRRTLATAGLAGVAMLPWFLADPGAMWHDTVRWLVDFPPLRFSDTLYIASIREWGIQPPFWLTGALAASTIGAVTVRVHRENPPPGRLLRWCALVLFVASLLNKQAFYNQFWLVAALVLLSWAVGDPAATGPDAVPAPVQPPHADEEPYADGRPASNRCKVSAAASQLHSRSTQARPASP